MDFQCLLDPRCALSFCSTNPLDCGDKEFGESCGFIHSKDTPEFQFFKSATTEEERQPEPSHELEPAVFEAQGNLWKEIATKFSCSKQGSSSAKFQPTLTDLSLMTAEDISIYFQCIVPSLYDNADDRDVAELSEETKRGYYRIFAWNNGKMRFVYQCIYCTGKGSQTPRSSDVARHVLKHRPQGNTCSRCGKKFSRFDSLKRHYGTCRV